MSCKYNSAPTTSMMNPPLLVIPQGAETVTAAKRDSEIETARTPEQVTIIRVVIVAVFSTGAT